MPAPSCPPTCRAPLLKAVPGRRGWGARVSTDAKPDSVSSRAAGHAGRHTALELHAVAGGPRPVPQRPRPSPPPAWGRCSPGVHRSGGRGASAEVTPGDPVLGRCVQAAVGAEWEQGPESGRHRGVGDGPRGLLDWDVGAGSGPSLPAWPSATVLDADLSPGMATCTGPAGPRHPALPGPWLRADQALVTDHNLSLVILLMPCLQIKA